MADLATLWAPHGEALQAAFQRVLARGQFVLGPELAAFEATLAQRVGVRHALGVSSGTDALSLALAALEIGPGDLVLTTPYSFAATAATILRCGARPVFVDIDPVRYNLCPDAVEAWLHTHPGQAGRVKALLPVHLFGACADLPRLSKLCDRLGAALIEDAAQALDAEVEGTPGPARAGALGTLGCFSFYPTKNLGALGDGGLVVTQDARLAQRLASLRSHGDRDSLGGNHRLDEVQAAWLQVLLPHLQAWTERRRAHAAAYDQVLTERLGQAPPRRPGDVIHQYILRVPKGRDAVRTHFETLGVETAVYYDEPLHLQRRFQVPGQPPPHLPEADRAAAETLALPVHAALTEAEHHRVLEALRSAPL